MERLPSAGHDAADLVEADIMIASALLAIAKGGHLVVALRGATITRSWRQSRPVRLAHRSHVGQFPM
jgi:hypothetical protein